MVSAALHLRSAAVTHDGLVRPNNEDAYLERPDLGLFVVCDGMGGHDGGEIASRLAVQTIERSIARAETPEWSLTEASAALRAAVEDAHETIVETSLELGFARPMGTTVVALLVIGETALVASVGDSRAYLLFGGRFLRITRDHTLANQYAELGLIPRSSVRGHPLRNVLARVVGSPAGMEPDLWEVALPPGARLLLCTDGLSEMVEEEHALRILHDARDPASGANELVEEALKGGGRDNVTVLIVECQAAEEPAAAHRVCA